MTEEDLNANDRVNSSGDQDNHEASEQIAIHVIDDANGGKDIEGVTSGITVHCDVDTFQWLLNFIKQEASAERFGSCELTIANVFPIIVSAEFLEMPSLVDECVRFIIQHFDELTDQPCNTSCFQPVTIERIARSFMPEKLSLVRESSFKSILFEQKVKDLLKHILKINSPPEGIPKLTTGTRGTYRQEAIFPMEENMRIPGPCLKEDKNIITGTVALLVLDFELQQELIVSDCQNAATREHLYRCAAKGDYIRG
nr:unnamed protein product [Spirometra erinaceieuropaei]